MNHPFHLVQKTGSKLGCSYFDEQKYVEYVAGDLPIVLVVSHGGSKEPSHIPRRKKGNGVNMNADLKTLSLSRELAKELSIRTKRYAHLIANHLHRSRLDPNRGIRIGAQDNLDAKQAWRAFHNTIKAALVQAKQHHGFAFLIDVHGCNREDIELGYGLHSRELSVEPLTPELLNRSTLRDIYKSTNGNPTELLRGTSSLGGLLTNKYANVIPSPKKPYPVNGYFSGGFIVCRYTVSTASIPGVSGVQIEVPLKIRKDPNQFAHDAVSALLIFFKRYYKISL